MNSETGYVASPCRDVSELQRMGISIVVVDGPVAT